MNTANFDLSLALIRVVIGCTIAAHGLNKFFGGGRLPGTAGWFDSIGMRPGRMHARLAATMETLSGVLLALGFLTSFASAGVVALMFVAAYTVHRSGGFFVVKNGWEYNFVLAAVAIGVAISGPGTWSIDHALGISEHLDGIWGIAVALAGGLASAIGLLAVYFRPEKVSV